MAARPKPDDKALIRRAKRAVKLGLKYEEAASCAGISIRTWYDWLAKGDAGNKRYTQFSQAIKAAEGQAAAKCMRQIVKAATKGQWQAAAWILERRFGYSKTEKKEHTGADGAPLIPTAASVTDLLDKLAQASPQMLEAALERSREPGE